MPSSFKKSLQGFLASVRSSVMENSGISLDGPLKRILSHQHATTWADVAFSNVMKCDDGLALLSALQNGYRISKASHFKKRPRLVFQNLVEHEFVVVHLRFKNKVTIFRIDRSIGHRSEPKSPKATTTSSEKSSYSLVPSLTQSTSSMDSILMSPSRVIDYCVCRLSTISPNRHWALDTIVEIPQLPSSNEAYELTTTEFTGPSSTWPSLWDLMHMVQFLNQQSEEYDLIDAQCYWYADMVSSLLGGWCPDNKVTRHHGWQGTQSKTLDIPVPGTIKGLVIYQRDPLVVEDKRSLLFEDIQSSTNSTMAFLEMRSGGDQAEARIKAVEERAERAEERAERAEERAERAEERAERAEERVEKAEERVEKAEEKAREAEAQTQELLKKFEARVSDSDALMARIVARLDDFKSHGLGPSIVA